MVNNVFAVKFWKNYFAIKSKGIKAQKECVFEVFLGSVKVIHLTY